METPEGQRLLGKIEATVTGTAEDVRLMRSELGAIARRLAAAEKAIAEVQAERKILVPQYMDFERKVLGHLAADASWKGEREGNVNGVNWTARLLSALIGILIGAGMIWATLQLGHA